MAAPDLAPAPLLVGQNVLVEDLSKRFVLFSRRRDRVSALFGRTARLAHKTALSGVSFTVSEGEALGLIGENGSGKSTLLRILAGISPADSGRAVVAAPVGAILELGLGFHPEFTGRENALLYGSLAGVSRAEMRARLPEVLAFAELGDFIDQPLRTYSSGMVARLAFAAATHVEPRVLLVDEALAVGDGAFQKKCVSRMVNFKLEKRTVIFCSHSMYLIAMFCDRVIWLHHGRLQGIGPPPEVIPAYERYLRQRESGAPVAGVCAGERAPTISITALRVIDQQGKETSSVKPGLDYSVEVELVNHFPGDPFHVGVTVDDASGTCMAAFSTLTDGKGALVGGGRWRARLHLPNSPFARGVLEIYAFALDQTGLTPQAMMRTQPIPVDAEVWLPGPIAPPHQWELEHEGG
ncbi:MAG: polysaccharide ABC transporter ATP-binding protein [Acidobacteriota bacterium]